MMSDRDNEPKKPAPARFPSFLGRTRAMSSGGSSGWEATTIGFTLVGCIAASSALGYYLDSRFGTGYWLPILFLVGVAAGFREMFRVLGRISRQQEQKKREKQERVRLAPNPTLSEEIAEAPARDRIFRVPPPPIAGQKRVETPSDEPESVDELIERLLEDDKDESK
ncbi:MAG: AtpZ/AtpI family protein [Armatimonadetes bacterium]|nr:AtpZ/AtpI family protein [Armatimonadota bacterium]